MNEAASASALGSPRKALPKYLALFGVHFKERLSSPGDVIARTLFFGVVIWVFSQLWSSLANSGAGLGVASGSARIEPRDLVWYLFVTEAIVLSLPPLTEQVDQDLQTGGIAYQLVRPLDYVLNRAMAFLGDVMARFVVNVGFGGLLTWVIVGAPSRPGLLLMAVPLVLGAFAIHLSFSLAIGMLGFWVEDTLPFFWMYSKASFVLGGLLMPIDYYPAWLQTACHAFPFQDGVYSVAQFALGLKPVHGATVLVRQLAWAGFAYLVAMGLFARGVRRLEVQGG